MESAKDKLFWQRVKLASLALSAGMFCWFAYGVAQWAMGTFTWVGFWR